MLNNNNKSKKERIKCYDIWCPAEKPSAEAIDEFLGFVLEGGYHVGEWRITADQLRRIVRRKNTCAGLDGWASATWRGLPLEWFECLAEWFNSAVENGSPLPRVWKQARAAMIPKAGSDDMRPLTIAVLGWRVCGTAVMQNLRSWIASWADENLYGGVPGVCADELHEWMHADLLKAPDENLEMVGAHIDQSNGQVNKRCVHSSGWDYQTAWVT